MGVFGNPLLHFDVEPKAIDTKSDQCEQKPLYIVSEKLSAGAIKNKLMSVDNRVLGSPALSKANRPRRTDSQGKENQKKLQNTNAYKTYQSACKFGFHKQPP